MMHLACLSVLLTLSALPAMAQEPDPMSAGAAYSAMEKGRVRLLPGEIVLPGRQYKDGEVWHALVCSVSGCRLQEVSLRVTPAELTPYDGEPIEAQSLALAKPVEGKLIALLQKLPATFLAKTPVTLLHAGMPAYPRAGTGTLEFSIPALNKIDARIVPRVHQPPAANRSEEPAVRIYLESAGRRQLLSSIGIDAIVGFDGMARGKDLVWWAGDLDGDGKLDLLASFNARVGEAQTLTLLLSSMAAGDDFVGEAGHFYYWPVGNPGC